MDKMISRLRSMSGSKLKSPTSATSPPITTPSKEDILSTLDGFGDKIPETAALHREDNNNIHSARRGSEVSADSDSWITLETGETEPTITSITHSYSVEWEKLFTKPNYLRHLRNYSLKGNLRSSRFRSIAWKLFLEVLPEDSTKWMAKTTKQRNKYTDLKQKEEYTCMCLSQFLFIHIVESAVYMKLVLNTFLMAIFFGKPVYIQLIVNPRTAVDTVDIVVNNPLSQEEESPWNRFFLDNELRLTIKQDVIRTFPEIQFYHIEEVRKMMINILFCYARDNPHICYKQGMHELLAPMIFVLHCDHQAFLHASEMESLDYVTPEASERIKHVMDPKYLEHDAYSMFAQVMETMEPWYVSKEVYPTKPPDPTNTQPFSRPQDMNPSNVIVTKLTRIQDYLLKKADHELHLHLERQEIAPQIYGIRWIRLLFGREFPMQDLLVLWDAIFADGIGFDLVDYIFVAMLLYLRDHLLSSDYPSCLITLMKYPPVGDIHYFIEKARFLRDPHQFPRPPNYTYQTAQTADKSSVPRLQKPAPSSVKGNNFISLTRKIYSSSRPKTLHVSGRQKMSKSSSEPMNLQTEVSPVSPTPGTVPQHKRGSSASLSQVEDSMFRSAASSGSLVNPTARSAVSTPGEISSNGSPVKYSTLPHHGRQKNKKYEVVDPSSEAELAAYRGLLNDKESMCRYCANKLDHHIDKLQAELLRQSLDNEDEILVSIAGIKQVRDVLKGTLRFSQNLLDEEEEININYNHYKMEVSSTSPDSDLSPTGVDLNNTKPARTKSEKGAQKRIFYVSSEENSEAIDSPSDTHGSGTESSNVNFKLPIQSDFELEDLKTGSTRQSSAKRGKMFRSGGPDEIESEFSKSWSPESTTTDISMDSDLEESPNPLYRIRNSSYNC